MSEKFLLKDHLFNKKSVSYLADLISAQNKDFNKKLFIKNILQEFPELELKQRISCVRRELETILSPDFKKACRQIQSFLPAR